MNRGRWARTFFTGSLQEAACVRAIDGLCRLLGFFEEAKAARGPQFQLVLDLTGKGREQPADAENPEALPEKAGAS